MKHVQFPYYFISDNCAYRLLGLMDLVRPELNLQQQFKVASIPIETLKAVEQENLVADVVYRPALETQLLAQARQHGTGFGKNCPSSGRSRTLKMWRQFCKITAKSIKLKFWKWLMTICI